MNEAETWIDMDGVKKKAWARILEAKCQYCKHFKGRDVHWAWQCGGWVVMSLETLNRQECPKYEWDNRLTKYDFEELA